MKYPEITITKLILDGHEREPPHGLSELVNRANAWGKSTGIQIPDGYEREVIVGDNGRLVTILRKVDEQAASKEVS